MIARYMLLFSLLFAGCNDNNGGTHLSNTERATRAGITIKRLNNDSAEEHIIAMGTSGTDYSISTSGGTTIVSIPDASSTAKGAVTSTDWTTFNSKIANVVEDTTPQLGGGLDVNGNTIVSTANADINLQPDGNGLVVASTAFTRGGFFQSYLSANMANMGAADVPVTFDTDEREDTDFYTHDEGGANPENITINQTGDYRISYNLNIRSSSGTDWQTYHAWLEINTVEQNLTQTHCLLYDSNGNRRHCGLSMTTVLSLTAGQVIRVVVTNDGNRGNGYVMGNESWILIERI
jgi:hypothetical protein